MKPEDLQTAAIHAWRIHVVRCSLIAVMLLVVPLAQRQLGFPYSAYGFDRPWGIVSLIFSACIAEWTRQQWRQFQGIKTLKLLPTSLELERAKAKDKLHGSMLNAGLLCCCLCLMSYALPGTSFVGFPGGVLWILPAVAAGAVLEAWRELRFITTRAR